MDPRLEDILSAAREESPTLPFPELVRRLRRRGAAVNERLLRRTLDREDSGVRVLNPWPGHLAPLHRYLNPDKQAGSAGGGPAEPGSGPARLHALNPVPRHLWVLTGPGDEDPPGAGAPAIRRIRATLRYLGSHLDARSPGDLARWVALVEEARTFPRAA